MAMPGEMKKLPSGVELRQWRIETNKSTILNSQEMEELQESLNAPLLPEMVFGRNNARFTHVPTKLEFEFNGIDSLAAWAKDCRNHTVDVAASQNWSENRREMIEKITRQTYDWTFTTPCAGKITRAGEDAESLAERTEEKIPLSLLMQPDPILFYDDIVLFEDELADNGTAMLTVKLRVMPTCFFSLQRFFLRVDDVLFRVIEIRLFHQFGKDFVLRERQVRSATHDDLVEAYPNLEEDKGKLTDQQYIASILPLLDTQMEKIPLSE